MHRSLRVNSQDRFLGPIPGNSGSVSREESGNLGLLHAPEVTDTSGL